MNNLHTIANSVQGLKDMPEPYKPKEIRKAERKYKNRRPPQEHLQNQQRHKAEARKRERINRKKARRK